MEDQTGVLPRTISAVLYEQLVRLSDPGIEPAALEREIRRGEAVWHVCQALTTERQLILDLWKARNESIRTKPATEETSLPFPRELTIDGSLNPEAERQKPPSTPTAKPPKTPPAPKRNAQTTTPPEPAAKARPPTPATPSPPTSPPKPGVGVEPTAPATDERPDKARNSKPTTKRRTATTTRTPTAPTRRKPAKIPRTAGPVDTTTTKAIKPQAPGPTAEPKPKSLPAKPPTRTTTRTARKARAEPAEPNRAKRLPTTVGRPRPKPRTHTADKPKVTSVVDDRAKKTTDKKLAPLTPLKPVVLRPVPRPKYTSTVDFSANGPTQGMLQAVKAYGKTVKRREARTASAEDG